jgi:hypothetical protein
MIPLWIKIAHTAFVVVLVPPYLRHYGAANFLWFSDIALFAMAPGLWLESPLIASMMAVGVLLLELTWNVDSFGRLMSGRSLIGLADYMFDARLPRWLRALSLFHVALPVLLLWTIGRLGYDPRALPAQTALAELVLVVTYVVTDPSKNVNWVFGPRSKPQRRIPPLAYLALYMLLLPVVVYWPTHLLLRRIFRLH